MVSVVDVAEKRCTPPRARRRTGATTAAVRRKRKNTSRRRRPSYLYRTHIRTAEKALPPARGRERARKRRGVQYDGQTGGWRPTVAAADDGRRPNRRRCAEHATCPKKRDANPSPGRRYRRKTVAGVWAECAAGGRTGGRAYDRLAEIRDGDGWTGEERRRREKKITRRSTPPTGRRVRADVANESRGGGVCVRHARSCASRVSAPSPPTPPMPEPPRTVYLYSSRRSAARSIYRGAEDEWRRWRGPVASRVPEHFRSEEIYIYFSSSTLTI